MPAGAEGATGATFASTGGGAISAAALDATGQVLIRYEGKDLRLKPQTLRLEAQLDGGEGKTSDSGLSVDVDRALVRVVGWGGVP